MKTLSCERTTELLPLYVAGDLEGARAREVASHLAACAECRERAAEFDASRALLSEAYETPEFGEEFYAGIRGAVLSEIARDRLTPSKPSLVAALFPARRLAFAAGFALLLLVSFVALRHFSSDARETPRQAEVTPRIAEGTQEIEDAPKKINKAARVDAAAPPKQSPARVATTPKSRSAAGRDGSVSHTVLAGVERAPGESISVERDRRGASAAAIPNESGGAQVATAPRESVDPVRTVTTPASSADPANDEPSPKVSRIEIQTADPNIRIIWLTPGKTDEPARDRDNHENGDRN